MLISQILQGEDPRTSSFESMGEQGTGREGKGGDWDVLGEGNRVRRGRASGLWTGTSEPNDKS